MPINLSKGQKVDLTKKNPGLKNMIIVISAALIMLKDTGTPYASSMKNTRIKTIAA